MSNATGPAVYIPTDKNIFDALQHKKVTQLELLKFLRTRGIFFPLNAPKDMLIERITLLNFGYHDFIWLTKLLENPNKKEKSTHTTLKFEVTEDDVRKACTTVKSNIEIDNSVKLTQKNGTTKLSVTYVDLDFSKTELRQRAVKTCDIEIEKTNEGVVLKMPSTKKAADIASRLKQVLSTQLQDGQTIEEFSINLSSIISPETRSRFFDVLVRNVPGYKFDTVTSVDVFHTIEDESEDDDDEREARLASYINRAALAGEGVLDSQEFQQLHKRGFFIYKIIWTGISGVEGGDKVEFETQFGSPSDCTDFKYMVRGIYNFQERTKSFNITRRAATPKENDTMNKLLREAAEQAYKTVINSLEE